jgi:hypothetical protein
LRIGQFLFLLFLIRRKPLLPTSIRSYLNESVRLVLTKVLHLDQRQSFVAEPAA